MSVEYTSRTGKLSDADKRRHANFMAMLRFVRFVRFVLADKKTRTFVDGALSKAYTIAAKQLWAAR